MKLLQRHAISQMPAHRRNPFSRPARAPWLLLIFLAATGTAARAQEPAAPKIDGYKDTPILEAPWHVHDPDRPQPAVVTPGDAPGKPPSDALALFDGKDLSHWRGRDGKPAAWKVEDGVMTPAGGDIETAEKFGDMQLHVEFATPSPASGSGQERGNSGVLLQGLYELQVLDSYGNRTYPDGQAAALYGQHPPLVNASRPPGEWQAYDIVFSAPVFAADGTVKSPARVTAFHNGVLVQNNAACYGPTGHRIQPEYTGKEPAEGPLKLQFHGNPLRYRNIWVRPLGTVEAK